MTLEATASEWDDFLDRNPDAHLLQTSAWGELKSAFGWRAARVLVQVAGKEYGAQVLFRNLTLGLRVAYLPKGPVGSEQLGPAALWNEIDALCRERGAIFLKVEPDQWERPAGQAPPVGFLTSKQAIQPARTLVIDLQGDEEAVLTRMKQKTRYNIRLALKKGVVVHPTADIETFYRLLQVTGGRDQFGVHSLQYYQYAYDLFHPRGMCELLVAEYQGTPLAGLMAFARGRRAWYFYGASAMDHRDRMPTYLLQWEAIRWARALGCTEYDLWGVPDETEEHLEASFNSRSDGLWGVYRFKRGFGGELRRSPGPWDRVYRPVLYRLYEAALRWRA